MNYMNVYWVFLTVCHGHWKSQYKNTLVKYQFVVIKSYYNQKEKFKTLTCLN